MVNKIIILIITLMLGSFAVAPIYAADSYHPTAKEFMERCNEGVKAAAGQDSNKEHTAWCIGYVQGVLDSNLFYNVLLTTRDDRYNDKISQDDFVKLMKEHQLFCIPDQLTLGQIINKLVEYGNQNPDVMSKKASLLIFLAFKKNFECKAQGSTQSQPETQPQQTQPTQPQPTQPVQPVQPAPAAPQTQPSN